MKYSGGSSSTLFCEQVSTVTSLFEKWNDCERTVVMYALLKRLRYPSLKFLQYSIENNLTQNFGSQGNLTSVDLNANNPAFLQKLINAYKICPTVELSQLSNDKESIIIYGSDLILDGNCAKSYQNKEDILLDVLGMLPLLKPGNDEAKSIYLSLIPVAVEDTVRQIVPTEVVQQIFSYLLIHPAISSEDRRSLSHWLRHLEDHIQSSFNTPGQQSFYVLSSGGESSSNSTSMSSVGSVSSRNPWQAIAPPSQSANKQIQLQQTCDNSSTWNVGIPVIADSLCDEVQVMKLNEIGSSQNSLIGGLAYDSSTVSNNNNTTNNNNNHTTNNQNDDHHVSFSKNGTEIIDFDTCDNCNGTTQFGMSSFLNGCDHFNMHRWSLDSKMAAIKTRRSNSLTTAISSSSSSNSSVVTVNDAYSNSTENLALYSQKPRSYSLSIEHPRSSLTSSESDPRLDELKPNYLKFTTHNVGMANIGQWLKSLRLHKYISLFTNMTYEEMLEISEEYLQGLGVTKGASHKLAMCIEKLNERYELLVKVEEDLLLGKMVVSAAVEELTNIVLTPMKPADAIPGNVAMKFLKALDLVCYAVLKMDAFSAQDEELVTVILWIVDRAMHAESFLNQMNHLKEQKFKLSKLKMSFVPKNHHAKNGSTGNLSKPRWTNKTRKSDGSSKTGSNDRIHRKNSNDILNYSISSLHQQQQSAFDTDSFYQIHSTPSSNHHMQQSSTNGKYISPSVQQAKSSSYPNFNSGYQQQLSSQTQHHLQQFTDQQKPYRNHRHSLNNLIVVAPNQQQQPQQVTFNPSNGVLSSSTDCNNRRPSLTNSVATVAPTSTAVVTTPSVATPTSAIIKPLEKTMAAVVLVSSQIKNNNSISTCNTNNATNIKNMSSSSNFIIPPNLVRDKNSKSSNSNISDIKSLEHLEFLCLQMTEQAIN